MSGFGFTSRIIGSPRHRAGSRRGRSRGSRSPRRRRRPGGSSRGGELRVNLRRARGSGCRSSAEPSIHLAVVGQDRPGARSAVWKTTSAIGKRLGLGQAEDADVELAGRADNASISTRGPYARLGSASPARQSSAGSVTTLSWSMPRLRVFGLGLDDRRARPSRGEADGVVRARATRKRGGRQPQAAQQGLGRGLAVAQGQGLGRAAGVRAARAARAGRSRGPRRRSSRRSPRSG